MRKKHVKSLPLLHFASVENWTVEPSLTFLFLPSSRKSEEKMENVDAELKRKLLINIKMVAMERNVE